MLRAIGVGLSVVCLRVGGAVGVFWFNLGWGRRVFG